VPFYKSYLNPPNTSLLAKPFDKIVISAGG